MTIPYLKTYNKVINNNFLSNGITDRFNKKKHIIFHELHEREVNKVSTII